MRGVPAVVLIAATLRAGIGAAAPLFPGDLVVAHSSATSCPLYRAGRFNEPAQEICSVKGSSGIAVDATHHVVAATSRHLDQLGTDLAIYPLTDADLAVRVPLLPHRRGDASPVPLRGITILTDKVVQVARTTAGLALVRRGDHEFDAGDVLADGGLLEGLDRPVSPSTRLALVDLDSDGDRYAYVLQTTDSSDRDRVIRVDTVTRAQVVVAESTGQTYRGIGYAAGRLAVVSTQALDVVDAFSAQVQRSVALPVALGPPRDVALSADLQTAYVAFGGATAGRLARFDLDSGTHAVVATFGPADDCRLALAPDGGSIIVGVSAPNASPGSVVRVTLPGGALDVLANLAGPDAVVVDSTGAVIVQPLSDGFDALVLDPPNPPTTLVVRLPFATFIGSTGLAATDVGESTPLGTLSRVFYSLSSDEMRRSTLNSAWFVTNPPSPPRLVRLDRIAEGFVQRGTLDLLKDGSIALVGPEASELSLVDLGTGAMQPFRIPPCAIIFGVQAAPVAWPEYDVVVTCMGWLSERRIVAIVLQSPLQFDELVQPTGVDDFFQGLAFEPPDDLITGRGDQLLRLSQYPGVPSVFESGPPLVGFRDVAVVPGCGNGAIERDEACDQSICCDATCRIADGPCCEDACNDGELDPGETCDGGRCCSGCEWEDAASCCGSACGDDVIDPGEECDNGPSRVGDGCSPSCAVEPCWTCASESGPSICVRHENGTACNDGDPTTIGDVCGDEGCFGVTTTTTSSTSTTSTSTSSSSTTSSSTSTSSSSSSTSSTSTSSPTSSSTSSSTTTSVTPSSTTSSLPACIPAACVDGDACTVDACDPIRGCTFTPRAPTEVAGVRCRFENLDRSFFALQCSRACSRQLSNLLGRARGSLSAVEFAGTGRRCRKKLSAASRACAKLAGAIPRLQRRGLLVLLDADFAQQAQRLAADAAVLRATGICR